MQESGAIVSDPRPSFPPEIERDLQGQLAAAAARGRHLPEAARALSLNVRLVQHDAKRCLVYAVESVSAAGFWAVGIAELTELQSQPLPWALVLLSRQDGHGFWMTGDVVTNHQSCWRRIVVRGPTYELTPADLANVTGFNARAELLSLLRQLR